MPKITYTDSSGTARTVEADLGSTVMETAIRNNIPGIEAECGGACACATCHVYVDEAWREKVGGPSPMEEDMEYFYFHNCLYERVWKENRRRFQATTPTWDVLHTYPHDYKVIFVGDASMSPYEVVAQGGSVEHYNDEPGALWLERVTRTYPACVWLNPVPEKEWGFTQSITMVHQLMGGRMYPLTLDGLDRATRELAR